MGIVYAFMVLVTPLKWRYFVQCKPVRADDIPDVARRAVRLIGVHLVRLAIPKARQKLFARMRAQVVVGLSVLVNGHEGYPLARGIVVGADTHSIGSFPLSALPEVESFVL